MIVGQLFRWMSAAEKAMSVKYASSDAKTVTMPTSPNAKGPRRRDRTMMVTTCTSWSVIWDVAFHMEPEITLPRNRSRAGVIPGGWVGGSGVGMATGRVRSPYARRRHSSMVHVAAPGASGVRDHEMMPGTVSSTTPPTASALRTAAILPRMPRLDAEIHELFEAVGRGEMAPVDAATQLGLLPYRMLGFASVDTHRELRQGAPEAILAEGKTPGEVVEIAAALLDAGAGSVMITRASDDVRRTVLSNLPGFREHERARALWAINDPPQARGSVVMLSAGTSDGSALHEARIRAELIGTRVCVYEDVGVAGLHRLAPTLDDLARADCVVVCAGMDGALTSVVGGLVGAPVIGRSDQRRVWIGARGSDGVERHAELMRSWRRCCGHRRRAGRGNDRRTDSPERGLGVTLTAYLDCISGIAGDMLLAALVDAGGDVELLHRLPAALGLDGVQVHVERTHRHQIAALSVQVVEPNRPTTRSWADIRSLLVRGFPGGTGTCTCDRRFRAACPSRIGHPRHRGRRRAFPRAGRRRRAHRHLRRLCAGA